MRIAIPLPKVSPSERRGWQLPGYAESTNGNVSLIAHQPGCPMPHAEHGECEACEGVRIEWPKGYSTRATRVYVWPQGDADAHREGPPTIDFRTALLVGLTLAPRPQPIRHSSAELREHLENVERLVRYGRTWTAADRSRALGDQALSEAQDHIAAALRALGGSR